MKFIAFSTISEAKFLLVGLSVSGAVELVEVESSLGVGVVSVVGLSSYVVPVINFPKNYFNRALSRCLTI
jgi:hypothetical protein